MKEGSGGPGWSNLIKQSWNFSGTHRSENPGWPRDPPFFLCRFENLTGKGASMSIEDFIQKAELKDNELMRRILMGFDQGEKGSISTADFLAAMENMHQMHSEDQRIRCKMPWLLLLSNIWYARLRAQFYEKVCKSILKSCKVHCCTLQNSKILVNILLSLCKNLKTIIPWTLLMQNSKGNQYTLFTKAVSNHTIERGCCRSSVPSVWRRQRWSSFSQGCRRRVE